MLGGEKSSEWKRVEVSRSLRLRVDSIFAADIDASIIIVGDFNGKVNTDAQKALGTYDSQQELAPSCLYNLAYYLLNKNRGTYRYKGNWQTIDYFIVSTSLLSGEKPLKFNPKMQIYSPSFLLEIDGAYYGKKPKPTYRGPRYVGGYSDHLPIYIETID